MTPKRVQMSRQRPWRADHPDAVIVDRRSDYGNPFPVGMKVTLYPLDAVGAAEVVELTAEMSVEAFRQYLDHRPGWKAQLAAELRGRDLACWCPLEDADGSRVPCHADVLLEIANNPSLEAPR
jgi:hypothetical protein